MKRLFQFFRGNSGQDPETPVTHEQVTKAMSKRKSDRELILEILKSGRTLTTQEAIDMGMWHAASRVKELRDKGYVIVTKLLTLSNGERQAQYSMPAEHRKDVF